MLHTMLRQNTGIYPSVKKGEVSLILKLQKHLPFTPVQAEIRSLPASP